MIRMMPGVAGVHKKKIPKKKYRFFNSTMVRLKDFLKSLKKAG